MKFVTGVLSIAVFFGLLGVYVGANPTKVDHHEKKYGSIVRLTQQGQTYCSGTVVSNTTILTASHCILSSEDEKHYSLTRAIIEIRPDNNKDVKVKAKVKSLNSNEDQAFLEGDFSQFEVVSPPVSNNIGNLTNYAAPLIACGYPHGTRLMCMPVIYAETPYVGGAGFEFNGVDYEQGEGYLTAVSGRNKLIPGMSGGPVFSSTGELVAINIAYSTNPLDNISFVSPLYDILTNSEK